MRHKPTQPLALWMAVKTSSKPVIEIRVTAHTRPAPLQLTLQIIKPLLVRNTQLACRKRFLRINSRRCSSRSNGCIHRLNQHSMLSRTRNLTSSRLTARPVRQTRGQFWAESDRASCHRCNSRTLPIRLKAKPMRHHKVLATRTVTFRASPAVCHQPLVVARMADAMTVSAHRRAHLRSSVQRQTS